MICLFNNQIYGDTYTSTHYISCLYNQEPSYNIKIPKSLDISENTTTFEYFVSGDLYANHSLNIIFENTVIKNTNDKTANVTVVQDTTAIKAENINDTYVKYQCKLLHNTLTPGIWSGELKMVITLTGDNT